MIYKIDMHIHTECSKDSLVPLSVIAKQLAKRGVNSAVVTDHDVFSIEKTTVIEGVTFFPGVELTTDRGHLLGLFMNGFSAPQYSGKLCDFKEAADMIHKYSGLCFLAHPYEYTEKTSNEISNAIRDDAPFIDGIEGFNCRAVNKRHNANELARSIANELSMPMSCGSDGHTPAEYGGAYAEVECESAEEIKNEIAAGRIKMYGSCVNRINMAKSQFIKRRKRKERPHKMAVAVLYFGVCAMREIMAFIRGENKKCQRL